MTFQKISKEQADYRIDPGNVLERCGGCHFFDSPEACHIVEGRIRREDTCDFYAQNLQTSSGFVRPDNPNIRRAL